MSSGIKNSIDWIINQVQDNMGDIPLDIQEIAKVMHKEEMIMFVLNVMGSYRHGDVLAEVATELYEQTFGGKQQQ